MDIRRVVKIFRRKFFVSQCRKVWQGNPFVLSFRKLPVSKKFMHRRGAIKIFRRKFLVPQCRKLWQGNPFVLFFRKLPVAKKIIDKRGRGPSRFSVESFLYHTAVNFRKGTLLCCVAEKFRLRKRLWTRKGDIKIFRRKDF